MVVTSDMQVTPKSMQKQIEFELAKVLESLFLCTARPDCNKYMQQREDASLSLALVY